MLKLILQLIKDRLNTFSESLITQGKTTALIHSLLSFFKHVFSDFNLGSRAEIGDSTFNKWRVFYHDILSTSLHISKICAALLSNNRLTEEGKELVDCRGHPIPQNEDVTQIVN